MHHTSPPQEEGMPNMHAIAMYMMSNEYALRGARISPQQEAALLTYTYKDAKSSATSITSCIAPRHAIYYECNSSW